MLHHFGNALTDTEKKSGFVIGSLGPDVPSKFNKSFDIVIGNPPWTRLREEELQSTKEKADVRSSQIIGTDVFNDAFTQIGRRVLFGQGELDELVGKYENPDKNPDLPFLWRATEWARKMTVLLRWPCLRVFLGGRAAKAMKLGALFFTVFRLQELSVVRTCVGHLSGKM